MLVRFDLHCDRMPLCNLWQSNLHRKALLCTLDIFHVCVVYHIHFTLKDATIINTTISG